MTSTSCDDMSGAYCRLASCAHVDLPTLVRVKWSDFETRHLHDALLAHTDALLDSALAVLDLGHVALARSLAILGSRNLAPVVGEHELADPKVAAAQQASHGEALAVRLRGARCLDVVPTTDALARLRVGQHRVSSVDLVLGLKVVGVGGRPVALQGGARFVVTHSSHRLIVRVEMD
jgi:hypothetical protein